jgi:hypothetical protein
MIMTNSENKRKYKLGVLVVLYGCEYRDSVTLLSLAELDVCKNTKLVIWNNGPIHVSDDLNLQNSFDVEIKTSIENLPLSYIYNLFLNQFICEKYVFFDHDSEICSNYLNKLKIENSDLFMPRIMVGGKCFFPTSRCSLKAITENIKTDSHAITSIMTGICISEKLKYLFINKFNSVFDERFALYGVDSTFFNRLTQIEKVEVSVFGDVQHSLSSQDPVESKSEFRRKERAFDVAIQLRHYPSKTMFKVFFLGVINSIATGDFSLATIYIKGFIQGVHPRSKNLL